MDCIVIFITASNREEADKIANSLVLKKLVACVNIVNEIKSVFMWKGKIERADEVLLIAKSVRKNFRNIVKEVKRLHSYECPEIIALPIVAGNKDYLEWVREETAKNKK